MKCVVGIDLGSTTTKAVLLDEAGAVLGRGITNSRSNYEAACAVAREEALSAARFDLLRRALAEAGPDDPAVHERGAALQDAFRLEQYLEQLAELDAEIGALLDGGHMAEHRAALAPAASQVLAEMAGEAPSLFTAGTERKSDFFRDLAAAAFMHAAEHVAVSAGVPFDRLAGLFDRAILNVETRLRGADFGATLRRAAARVAGSRRDGSVALLRLADDVATHRIEEIAFVGTGYGRQTLPFPKEAVRSEILCHGRGAHRVYADTRTVLDIGGQDTKAIQVDAQGVVTGFQMNDRCAAGCGRYLGYIADELNLGLHELGPLALRATKAVKVNSTCTVFAGAELRERLALGQRREDILAGLHRAIMLRAMSLVARSGGITNEFTFTGGVCRNPMATRVLGDLVRQNYGEAITINAHPDSIYMGALGAALFALDDARAGRPAILPAFAARIAAAA
jgi:benzoyl-CoA reductase subunit A